MNSIQLNDLKDKLLGLYLNEAEIILDNMNLNYKIIQTSGIKDKELLKDKRVVNINLKKNIIVITISYFYTENM